MFRSHLMGRSGMFGQDNTLTELSDYPTLLFVCLCFQGKMIMQDKLEKERNDAKNGVEEYVYEMRDKLHSVLEKFVSEAVSVSVGSG